MHRNSVIVAALALSFAAAAWPQSAPIYRIDVIERTVKAVNYQYRNGPTKIDFRGTVLLPQSKGEATVEANDGRTEIDARLTGIAAPTRFGPEYLTYVLWAITPEGHARNLGEVLANGSDRARLHVTTGLQVFGLIVTAEPYSAVRQPSNVVVMENEIRPDTVGRIEQIQAKYELLPRGSYTYTVPADMRAAEGNGPKLSLDQYQAVVELYQAQNAVQIAESAGAAQYAPDTFEKAQRQLADARALRARKSGSNLVVTAARAAAQTAEDARTIAVQRKQGDELAQARAQAARDRAALTQAEAAEQRAASEASAARSALEQERDARQRAEMQTAAQPAPEPPQPEPAPAVQPPPAVTSPQKSALRMGLLNRLNAELEARDTPRGLVIVVPDADFQGTTLRPALNGALARVASVVSTQPGLRVEVEGNSDTGDEAFSYGRAVAIRDALVRGGLSGGEIVARGLGNSHPVVSNASAAGREQNRRVEIVITGEPIGTLPYWAKTYSVAPR
jgi:outer membrane protein OmpA-like peptidoglycan-associated protein